MRFVLAGWTEYYGWPDGQVKPLTPRVRGRRLAEEPTVLSYPLHLDGLPPARAPRTKRVGLHGMGALLEQLLGGNRVERDHEPVACTDSLKVQKPDADKIAGFPSVSEESR